MSLRAFRITFPIPQRCLHKRDTIFYLDKICSKLGLDLENALGKIDVY